MDLQPRQLARGWRVEALASGGDDEWRRWRVRRCEWLASGGDAGSTGGGGEGRGRRGADEALADPLEGIGGSCEARGVARGSRRQQREIQEGQTVKVQV